MGGGGGGEGLPNENDRDACRLRKVGIAYLNILVSLKVLRKEISVHLLKNDHRHTDLEY